jgi:hypothetical protein
LTVSLCLRLLVTSDKELLFFWILFLPPSCFCSSSFHSLLGSYLQQAKQRFERKKGKGEARERQGEGETDEKYRRVVQAMLGNPIQSTQEHVLLISVWFDLQMPVSGLSKGCHWAEL